jgi:HSP20 family protein
MDLDRLKQDVGQTWRWLAEGWRNISDRASNALTYFTPSHEAQQEGVNDIRWGLLAADVSVEPDQVLVELEAPGLDKEDIDIDVQGRRLIVTGRKSYQAERKSGSMTISERAFGHFQRVIPLPEEVTAEKAQASYRKGVLRVTLPKLAPATARKVQVVSD